MATIKQEIVAKLANLEGAYAAEKSKLEGELAAIGPLAEHEIESLKSWMQAALRHIGG
jgi:hypothetical protein